eukprot:s406_g18.t2
MRKWQFVRVSERAFNRLLSAPCFTALRRPKTVMGTRWVLLEYLSDSGEPQPVTGCFRKTNWQPMSCARVNVGYFTTWGVKELWEPAMSKYLDSPRGRVRYEPMEPLEGLEEEEDGLHSQTMSMFTAGEELLEFRRVMSKTSEAQKDSGPARSPRSDASNISAFSQRPTRLLDLLPVAPWCGKCLPQPPDGQLPIKPEELVLGQAADIKALTENINEYGRLTTSSKRTASRSRAGVQEEGPVKFHTRTSRIEQLAERLKLTATHPTTFFARTVERPEEIELMPSMIRSRFSRDDFTGYDVQMNPASGSDDSGSDSDSEPSVAKPLTKFTTEQVSRMELVALNHVKMQTLKQRIAEEGVHSIRARRTCLQTKFASLWQLLRMRQDGTISPEENYYLMAQLRFLPFFNEVPQELYETIVEQTTTQTYVPGCHLFREGDTANSLFLILTGQVHLRSETQVAMAYDTMKSSPALLLQHDLFSQSRGQPFLLRKVEDRTRSQTAVASLRENGWGQGEAGPSTTVAFIFPDTVLELVSKHYREQEAEHRWHIVRHFAKTQRLSLQACSKHQEIFRVLAFPRSYLFVNAGSKPDLEDAHIYYVMEGELSVVQPARKDHLGRPRGKATKETVGKGYLIGEAALYGEAYPCAVVSTTEVKVLVVKASAYLHQLLNRSSVLQRPEGYLPPEGPVGDSSQVRGRRKLIEEQTSFTAKTIRLKKDRVRVEDEEWKACRCRSEMPVKVPPGGHHRLLSVAKNQGRHKVLEHSEIEIPKVPIVADVGRSGDGHLTRSMNQKLSSTSRQLELLEAAHRSHTTFHYHVEEIGGSPPPRAKVLSVSPGSRMLMACGAMSPRPPTARLKIMALGVTSPTVFALMLLVLCALLDDQLQAIFQTLGMSSDEARSMARNPCAKTGIVCNANGQIVSIHLQARDLQGKVPKELGQLQSLNELHLQQNRLSGEIPGELGQLQNLVVLDLSDNQLTGEIPHELGQLQNLFVLDLSDNQLTREIPHELGQLKGLVWLILTNNQLGGEIPSALGKLEELEGLSLQQNYLSGEIPFELGRLKSLRLLYLEDNQLGGEIPSELGQLQNLQKLDLGNNKLTGEIPHELGQLKNLEWLYLQQNWLKGAIPSELGRLRNLTWLHLYQNQLTGAIPPELAQLENLEELSMQRNQLSGEIPSELGRLKNLKLLYLEQNQLSGEIPRELGQLQNLYRLILGDNQLTGEIPHELGQLKNLKWLYLHKNRLSGEIPSELGQLKKLTWLYLYQNQLSGEIPPELGELQNAARLSLQQNQLRGKIPSELGQLKGLILLYLEQNQLSGEIPSELCHLPLTKLLLHHNRLTKFPSVCKMPLLKVFDGSFNSFAGELPVHFSAEKLTHLDLSHNKFVGGISHIVDFFCSLSPMGGMLRELRLNHNDFTGELPSCLMQFGRLTFLTLNNNKFYGSIPEVNASRLAVLSLHKNALTGVLPESFETLNHLGVLTLHENSIGGAISSLNLTVPCLDNSKFHFGHNINCDGCKYIAHLLDRDQLSQIENNCPESLRKCPSSGIANITLHHNRFSCRVPESIAGTTSTRVLGLVLMGNMLGDGNSLSSWISKEENQPFLFYSPSLWTSNMLILAGFLALISLKSASAAFLGTSPLLLIYTLSGKYFECSPPLWQTTIAGSKANNAWSEYAVVTLWCMMQVLFRSIVVAIPKATKQCQPDKPVSQCNTKLGRVLVWFLWVCIVALLSLPSVFFTFAQSLPSQNSFGFSDDTLQLFGRTGPIQTVIIDMLLAAPLSSKFSNWTGVKADRLLMTFRLFSAWLLAVATTAALDENCLGGWKVAWKVCQEGSEEHNRFNWKVYDEEILNTTQDICSFSTAGWSDGRCSRAIVGNLAPFLLEKLLVRSTVQPLVLWMLWHFSRLEATLFDPKRGRHRRFFGVWPKTTGSLVPLQQMALLTTLMVSCLRKRFQGLRVLSRGLGWGVLSWNCKLHILPLRFGGPGRFVAKELLIFWSPLIPLLCIGIFTAALTNGLIFDLGVGVYEVVLPTDDMNEGAALSKSYLMFTLAAGVLFQLWHAFCTEMFGRYLLLAFSIVTLGPWAERCLPVRIVKQRLWADETSEADGIELQQMEGHAGWRMAGFRVP